MPDKLHTSHVCNIFDIFSDGTPDLLLNRYLYLVASKNKSFIAIRVQRVHSTTFLCRRAPRPAMPWQTLREVQWGRSPETGKEGRPGELQKCGALSAPIHSPSSCARCPGAERGDTIAPPNTGGARRLRGLHGERGGGSSASRASALLLFLFLF